MKTPNALSQKIRILLNYEQTEKWSIMAQQYVTATGDFSGIVF